MGLYLSYCSFVLFHFINILNKFLVLVFKLILSFICLFIMLQYKINSFLFQFLFILIILVL